MITTTSSSTLAEYIERVNYEERQDPENHGKDINGHVYAFSQNDQLTLFLVYDKKKKGVDQVMLKGKIPQRIGPSSFLQGLIVPEPQKSQAGLELLLSQEDVQTLDRTKTAGKYFLVDRITFRQETLCGTFGEPEYDEEAKVYSGAIRLIPIHQIMPFSEKERELLEKAETIRIDGYFPFKRKSRIFTKKSEYRLDLDLRIKKENYDIYLQLELFDSRFAMLVEEIPFLERLFRLVTGGEPNFFKFTKRAPVVREGATISWEINTADSLIS